MTNTDAIQSAARLELSRPAPDTLVLGLSGQWQAQHGLPGLHRIQEALASEPGVRRLAFDTAALQGWNSGLITFLLNCHDLCEQRQVLLDRTSLPAGAQRLMDLALAVPPPQEPRPAAIRPSWVARVGLVWLRQMSAVRTNISFLGECILALGNLLRRRSPLRWPDTLLLMQQSGVEALPIVSLIALLVGLIMAFVGSVQLSQFGASIYVADLVAIAMVREMGCMMTAVIMCGRTGAAFAAQLGTMKVNQEIDAFTAFGVSPMDFLVLPRLLALSLMIPLLTVFADLVGILGGFIVAMAMLDLSLLEYWNETVKALTLTQFSTGIVKSVVFGVIIAVTACLRGMQCGTNAAAVGLATTSAVVTGITWVIVADAIFAVIFNVLRI